MKIKRIPEDFQVEEILDLEPGAEGRYALYLLEKRSLNTLDAVRALARVLDLPREAVGFAGLKDRHALSRQTVSVPGGPERNVKGKGFHARYVGRGVRPVSSALLRGNRFRIVVRDLTRARAASLQEGLRAAGGGGVPNYFDEQRFGSARHGGGFIAERMARGDFEGALRLFMATPSGKDGARRRKLGALIRDRWGGWAELEGLLPPGTERRIVSHLARNPGDFGGALDRIDGELMSIFLHAWQSLLWNRFAVRLLEREGGLPTLRWVSHGHGRFLFPFDLDGDTKARFEAIRLPLPGRTPMVLEGAAAGAVEAVLAEEGLSLEDFRLKGVRAYFKTESRPFYVFPRDLHVGNPQPDDLYPRRRRLTCSFSLPPGSYATILIKSASAVDG